MAPSSGIRPLLLAGLLVASALSLAACDALGGDGGEARMTVRLTDAPFPFDLADSANVSIVRIDLLAGAEAVGAEAVDRIVLFDAEADGGPLDFNLLDLRDGVAATLVNAFRFPADGGHDRLRIVLGDDARVVLAGGAAYDLKTPSAQRSGLTIDLPAYSLAGAGETVDVLLDFDVEASFVVRGGTPGMSSFQGFLFTPVLEVESFEVRAQTEVEEGVYEDGSDAEARGEI